MTRLPDISNRNINKYARAMEALAKGVDVTKFTQDYINDKRSLAQTSYRAKESAKNNENITDEQSDAWRGWDSAGEIFYADALDEIERLQSQLAARDALIERLVDCGDALADLYDSEMYPETAIESRNWRALIDEWQAMKGGE